MHRNPWAHTLDLGAVSDKCTSLKFCSATSAGLLFFIGLAQINIGAWWASALIIYSHFHPSLILGCKAGACMRAAPMGTQESLPAYIRLGCGQWQMH